jgi:RNA polymerase sigma-70 factor (ECF subfamily)
MSNPIVSRDTSDEAELILRSRRHDREAFGELVERYADSVFNLVARMVGKQPDAEVLSRETFLAAFDALPTFQAGVTFSAWLYRMALSRCREWLQRNQRESIEDQDDGSRSEYANHGLDDRPPEPPLSPEQIADGLNQAIQSLPPLYREAFILRHLEGLSYEELGEILDARRETLKMRVYQARARLSQDLVRLRGEG